MALADYCQCSVCGGKTFYDANTNWWESERVGIVVALCADCFKTHEVKVLPRSPADSTGSSS